MSTIAQGTFEVDLTPATPELDGGVDRFDFTKVFHGELEGVSTGVMLSCGDPQRGSAGYVAIETVDGRLAGRQGRFALQQFGTMRAGEQALQYEVVPGSGHDGLAGITGAVRLTIEGDGTHRYELEYQL